MSEVLIDAYIEFRRKVKHVPDVINAFARISVVRFLQRWLDDR